MGKSNAWRLGLHFVLAIAFIAAIWYLIRESPAALWRIEAKVRGGAGTVLDYAAVVAVVGTVAVALVEFLKAAFDLQRLFHEWKLAQWIGDEAAREELLYLAIGDRERADALCGQPIEKMMGQVQAAANVALDFPAEYPALYRALTTTDIRAHRPEVVQELQLEPGAARSEPAAAEDAARRDRDAWHAWTSPPAAAEDAARRDREAWHAWTSRAPRRSETIAESAAPPGEEEQEAARARIRLANLVARKLDGFQLRTQYYWQRSNQVAAVVASMVIASLAVTSGQAVTLESVALALMAGAVAPFVKDLTSGLAGLGKGK